MLPSASCYDSNAPSGSRPMMMSTASSQTYVQARTPPVAFSGPALADDGPTKMHAEECAEDECLGPDNCGNESRPPKPENLCWGIDTRPALPIALGLSTVIGMLVMMVLELPLLSRLISGEISVVIGATFMLLYGVILGCMAYCAFSDPGQVRKDQQAASAPKRAYKSWQFKRPVRRYDHYCRWLSNCIGLLNHREFVAMLIGLVLVGGLGIIVDVLLTVSMVNRGFWDTELAIVAHLAYSVALLALACPIFRIHAGLVSRNELAAEWKRNEFYIAKSAKHGDNVPVNDLSDEEFNTLFDSFVYDQKRNAFDRGWVKNCFTFWCVPRWAPDQLGEF
mmetsp:Transcript_63984/g.128390  ORF Transcript_63984/g.128390 Transcript_63984/m.128390 type:complete len:336 (-) Transcript_63984:137-1144(-)